MGNDSQIHHRRSIRLADYDYSQMGTYFVTVCVQGRRCLFGDIADGEMRLNDAGRIVVEEWASAAAAYPSVVCDTHVVMPNHFHGIVVFSGDIGATGARAAGAVGDGIWPVGAIHELPLQTPPESPRPMSRGDRRAMGLSKFVGRFKMRSAKRINELRGTPGVALWQRNYYEHIIRDEAEWGRIREYIATNPARWAEDRENPHGKTEKE